VDNFAQPVDNLWITIDRPALPPDCRVAASSKRPRSVAQAGRSLMTRYPS